MFPAVVGDYPWPYALAWASVPQEVPGCHSVQAADEQMRHDRHAPRSAAGSETDTLYAAQPWST